MDSPLLVLVLSLAVLWLSSRVGIALRDRGRLQDEEHEDFVLIVSSTLTLLALIIGFTFSMAISRYDQRKNYEESEANAIGTEYVRADLLPAADGARLRGLLKNYLDQRILFYTTSDEQKLRQIDLSTAQLQSEMWSAVQAPAAAQSTPTLALIVSGMNDVLNAQGYTQAAWWNRIPIAAWCLMIGIAIFSILLLGYGARRAKAHELLLLVLPLVISIAFFLIAEIDSPRGGVIRVQPQNLLTFAQTLGKA
jgi:hypothetical protein